MAVVPPNGLICYTVGELDGILTKYPDLREALAKSFSMSYSMYITQLFELDTYEAFFEATFMLAFSVKQAYHFHVCLLGKEDLMGVMDRTIVSTYLSGGLLYAHVDLVPETVKSVHYKHVPFTDKLH